MKQVYFDNAATTPMDPKVLEEMMLFMKEEFGNPSSIHSVGRRTKARIELIRKQIADYLKATPSEIVFTSGGTEADNMAISCSVRDLGVTRIITSEIEHHAVLNTVEKVTQKKEVKLEFVQLDDKGNVDLNNLEMLLHDRTEKTLVSLMHANNEIGNLLPIHKVSEICNVNGAIFHSDTVQTVGHYPLDLSSGKIDFITCAAHKFHGPKGIGFLYVNKKLKIDSFIQGGAQERGLRSGTENSYGIVGLGKAMELAHKIMIEQKDDVLALKRYMKERLIEEIKDVRFYGNDEEHSLYTILNVSFPAFENADMLLFNLDLSGIAVSGGSACSSGSNQGSHVLNVIEKEEDRPAVRFSFSKLNTKEEIDYCIEKLKQILN